MLTKQTVDEELIKIYKEQRRIIREAMNTNQLVLFVGAGASIDSGMPSWNEAIANINEKLGIDKAGDNLLVPQYYYNTHGKKKYNELMQSIFKFNQPLPTTDIHDEIVKFNVNTIITTNYDHLIEDAFEKSGQSIQVISKDKDLAYANDGKILIKMHGDFENDNFVLKEDDYLNYSNNFKLIENYIKSLIGTKVILFIGYSLSDPDVKQIINWVKTILDNDLQRAYPINASSTYSKYESEYFKNLGVDIIYSKSVIPELIDNNIGKNTKDTLSDILKNDIYTIDKISESLIPLKDLNYISNRYIEKAFENTNIHIKNGVIYTWNDDSQFLKMLCDSITNPKSIADSRYPQLVKILTKSSISAIAYNENDKTLGIDSFDPEKLEPYMNFDFNKLDLIYQNNQIHLSDNTPESYLQNAYIDYINERYLPAYNNLNQASRIYFHLKSYTWYFICQVNLHHLGKLMNSDLKAYLQISKINEIVEQCKQIDLYKLINSLPKSHSRNNSFFTDLITFTDIYSNLSDVNEQSEKIEEEANSDYIMHTGDPAYVSLESKLHDQLNNQIANYIMNDRYTESLTVNKLYLKSILSSYASPRINPSSSLPGLSKGNIKKETLNSFDIHLLLSTYKNSKELRKILNQLNITYIKLDQETFKYLKTIIINITSTNINNHSHLFWLLVQLLAYTDLTVDIVEKVLDSINTYGTNNSLNDNKYTLVQFLNNAYIQNIFICDNNRIKDLLKDLIYKSLYFAKNDAKSFHHLNVLEAYAIEYNKCGGHLDDPNIIDYFYKNDRIDILIYLYFCLSDSLQRDLQLKLKNYRFKNTAKSYYEYYVLVNNKIIDFDTSITDSMFSLLNDLLKKNENSNSISYPSPGFNLMETLIFLYQGHFIDDKNKMMAYAKKFETKKFQWEIDPISFNYDNFDISWLENENDDFLYELSQNENIKSKIIDKFKKAYNGTYKNKLIKKFFKYFI